MTVSTWQDALVLRDTFAQEIMVTDEGPNIYVKYLKEEAKVVLINLNIIIYFLLQNTCCCNCFHRCTGFINPKVGWEKGITGE